MSNPPVVEVSLMKLKPGADIYSGESHAATAWHHVLKRITEQPGYKALRHGLQLEDPMKIVMLVEWQSIEHHASFTKSQGYKTFMEDCLTVIESSPIIWYFLPTPFQTDLFLRAPVIEMCCFYHTQADIHSNVNEFVHAGLQGVADGYEGSVYGHIVPAFGEPTIMGKEKASAYLLCVGWDSKAKHLEWKATENAEKTLPLIRKSAKNLDVFHVKLEDNK